jgi:hypothetical protein
MDMGMPDVTTEIGLTVEGSDSVSLSPVPKTKGIEEEGRMDAIKV